jgi:cell fate regulator YaaT (PSP1 superfamily)
VVPKQNEQEEKLELAQPFIEVETRRMIECALKFMRSAKRDEPIIEDFEAALKYMSIHDIKLTSNNGR